MDANAHACAVSPLSAELDSEVRAAEERGDPSYHGGHGWQGDVNIVGMHDRVR